MIYKSELPSIVISDCYIDRGNCYVILEVVDSISYIKKLCVQIRNNCAIIRVKKTIFKKFMGKNSIYFPSENIESVIIKKWD